MTTTGNKAGGRRVPSDLQGRVPVESVTIPAVLSAPEVLAREGIRTPVRGGHRLTDVSRLFVVECINSGYTDRQIDDLLRRKKFLGPKDPPLSRQTMNNIRNSDECALDISLLTLEARQAGHNRISRAVLYWAEIMEEAYACLMGEKSPMGRTLKPMTAAECNGLIMNATKVIMATFAADIAKRLRDELEAAATENTVSSDTRPAPEVMADYVDNIMADVLSRHLLELGRAKQQALEEGAGADDGD